MPKSYYGVDVARMHAASYNSASFKYIMVCIIYILYIHYYGPISLHRDAKNYINHQIILL